MLLPEKYILYLPEADLATHSIYQVSFYSVFIVNVTGSGLGTLTMPACTRKNWNPFTD